jgi:TolB-like protein/Tfp pilus assembly protein PilF
MAHLHLRLLGDFAASGADGAPVFIAARKNRALLALLSLQPSGSLSRERIAALLWSDRGEEQARRSLRQALTVLRSELRVLPAMPLASTDERVALDLAQVSVDAREFEKGLAAADIRSVQRAVSLYGGRLLSDVAIRDEGFEEWLRLERQRYLDLAIAGLERVCMGSTGSHRVRLGKQLVALDPLREASQKALISAYIDNGERSLALQQMASYRNLLREQLDVAPSAELEALERRVRSIRHGVQEDAAAPDDTRQKPSIAVLPISNRSGDPEQDFFCAGLSEDITAGLSRFRSLLVTSQHSSFLFRDESVAPLETKQKLNASYVVEGSVRRHDKHVRITIQLVDAEKCATLWVDQTDSDIDDIPRLQDETIERIIATIADRIERNEWARAAGRRPRGMRAYDLVLRARAIVVYTSDSNRQSRKLYEEAIALEPECVPALIGLAWTHCIDSQSRWNNAGVDSLQLADKLARRALELDKHDHRAHELIGFISDIQGKFDEALIHYRHAVSLNSNSADTAAHMGMHLVGMGQFSQALSWFQRATRLNPLHPVWYLFGIGEAYYGQRLYEQAIAPLCSGIHRFPNSITPRRHLAAVYAQMGRIEEAKSEIAKVLALDPCVTLELYRRRIRYQRAEDLQHYLEGLQKAGLPD